MYSCTARGHTNELSETPDHVGEAEGVDSIAIAGKLVTDSTDVLRFLQATAA